MGLIGPSICIITGRMPHAPLHRQTKLQRMLSDLPICFMSAQTSRTAVCRCGKDLGLRRGMKQRYLMWEGWGSMCLGCRKDQVSPGIWRQARRERSGEFSLRRHSSQGSLITKQQGKVITTYNFLAYKYIRGSNILTVNRTSSSL